MPPLAARDFAAFVGRQWCTRALVFCRVVMDAPMKTSKRRARDEADDEIPID